MSSVTLRLSPYGSRANAVGRRFYVDAVVDLHHRIDDTLRVLLLVYLARRPVSCICSGPSRSKGGLPFVTVGAVLFAPGEGPHFFGAEVGASKVARQAANSDSHVIGQAELIDRLLGCFVDNDSARYAAIAGCSPVKASAAILDALASVDAELGVVQWFARVPSASNLADGPSRLDFASVAALQGAVRCDLSRCARFVSWDALATRLG